MPRKTYLRLGGHAFSTVLGTYFVPNVSVPRGELHLVRELADEPILLSLFTAPAKNCRRASSHQLAPPHARILDSGAVGLRCASGGAIRQADLFDGAPDHKALRQALEYSQKGRFGVAGWIGFGSINYGAAREQNDACNGIQGRRV